MRKRALGILLLCLTLLSGLSAQGAKGKMELTFFYPIQVGGPLTKLIEKICTDFTAENPGIVIKPVYTGSYDDTVIKIQTAVAGKTPPDVFVNLATQRFSMASSGVAIPLDGLIAADGDAGKQYIADFLPGFMEDSYVDGKILFDPFPTEYDGPVLQQGRFRRGRSRP